MTTNITPELDKAIRHMLDNATDQNIKDFIKLADILDELVLESRQIPVRKPEIEENKRKMFVEQALSGYPKEPGVWKATQ